MAQRLIFVPKENGDLLVKEVPIDFAWHRGMSVSQKRKNITALHQVAEVMGLHPLLEISSKSERTIGQRMSAFALNLQLDGRNTTVESAFQGSKVFENGGPFHDLYWVDSKTAKRDPRLKDHGRLIRFDFANDSYPTWPATAFYDWLYINALLPHRKWLKRIQRFAGFTDIEFNPQRSVNCQARSCATFVALETRGLLDRVMVSFDQFRACLQRAPV